jgi:putative transposase
VPIGRRLAASLMKGQSLRAISPRDFKPRTTDAKHHFGFSPNLLQNLLKEPTAKGEVIVGNIIYLLSRGGRFCYLATFQDKYTRRVVRWQVSDFCPQLTLAHRLRNKTLI